MNQSATRWIGKMIRGYCLEELLTYDDATATYRARTRELWQIPEVLITVLLLPEHFAPGSALRSRFRDRFLQEAQDIAALRHHYLLPLYGCGEQDGLLYLLGPKMPGETLADQMQHKKRWTPEEALALLTPLASVLDYIHEQGLAYQFLQPSRIILQSSVTIQLEGLGRYSLLRKQGLAEESQPSSSPYEHLKSITDTYLGAPQYIAPEVLKGAKADRRSDVYSLGVLLCELLSGKLVLAEQDYLTVAEQHVREPLPALRELAPDMPASLELVLNRALSRNPERRFQRPAALLNAYSQMLDLRLQQPAPVRLVQQIEQMFLASPAQAAPLQLQAPTTARLPAAHQKLQELAAPFSQPLPAAPPPPPAVAQAALPAPVAPVVPSVPVTPVVSPVPPVPAAQAMSAVPVAPVASTAYKNIDALSEASSEETLLVKRDQLAASRMLQSPPTQSSMVARSALPAPETPVAADGGKSPYAAVGAEETLLMKRDQLPIPSRNSPVENQPVFSAASNVDYPGHKGRLSEDTSTRPAVHVGEEVNLVPTANGSGNNKIANKVTRTVDSVPQIENPFDGSQIMPDAAPIPQEEDAFAQALEQLEKSSPPQEAMKQTTEVAPSESEREKKTGSEPVTPFEEPAKTSYSSLLEELAKTQYITPFREQSDPMKEAMTDEVMFYPISQSGVETTRQTESPLTNTDEPRTEPQTASTQVMAMAGQLRELKARLQAQSRATGIRRLDDNAGAPQPVRQASRLP